MSTFLHAVSQFFESFLGSRPPAAPPPTAEDALQTTAHSLDESLSSLTRLAQDLKARFPEEEGSSDPVETQQQRREAAARAQRERMRQAILEAHGQLGTGLDMSSLERLGVGMKELLPYFDDVAGSDVTRRILAWTLRRLFCEVGLLSWNRLMRLMERAGLSWPRPGGLMPTAGPEEIARAIERNREEDRELFLRKPPEMTAQLMVGVVEVWKAAYPDPDTGVYQETVLQGVACGLRIYLVEWAAELAYRDPELLARVQGLLERELDSTRALLARGLSSSQEFSEVVSGTDLLCRETVPALVWSWLEPRILALVDQPPVMPAGV